MSNSKSEVEFGKDLGIMHELAITGRALGMTRGEWSKLAHDKFLLYDVMKLIQGTGVLKMAMKPVDFSEMPAPKPNTWTDHRGNLRPYRHGGSNDWDAFCGNLNRHGRSVEVPHPALAHPGFCKLGDPELLNSNHLDFLLKYPSMIPVEWLDLMTRDWTRVFFIGTVFQLEGGNGVDVVRYLDYNDGAFEADWCSLNVIDLGNKDRKPQGRPEAVAYICQPKAK
jgi:hypothetical protein